MTFSSPCFKYLNHKSALVGALVVTLAAPMALSTPRTAKLRITFGEPQIIENAAPEITPLPSGRQPGPVANPLPEDAVSSAAPDSLAACPAQLSLSECARQQLRRRSSKTHAARKLLLPQGQERMPSEPQWLCGPWTELWQGRGNGRTCEWR